jgi:putative membrane protein
MVRIALAVIHLVGWAMALGSVFARARALTDVRDRERLHRGLAADNWWGISAIVLIGTGLWRAFGSLEKSSSYYWSSHAFYAKMGTLALVLLLEFWPMITLIRWRVAEGRGSLPDMGVIQPAARRIARISDMQTLLLLGIVTAAVMMARGFGAG